MIARALVIGYLANSPRGGDLFLFISQRRVGIIECAFFDMLGGLSPVTGAAAKEFGGWIAG